MANPFEERKNAIGDWRQHSIVAMKETNTILNKAEILTQIGLRSKDALHLSCAISGGCEYFLTTDDKILNKNRLVTEIILMDPIGFVKEVYP